MALKWGVQPTQTHGNGVNKCNGDVTPTIIMEAGYTVVPKFEILVVCPKLALLGFGRD